MATSKTTPTRAEMRDSIQSSIGSMQETIERSAATLAGTMKDRIDSFEKLMTERLDGIKRERELLEKIQDERQTRNNERLDDLEADSKSQRWWSVAATFFGGVLGFGGGKVIH